MAVDFIIESIQVRRDSQSDWSTVNPILLQGEPGYELDTGRLKIGDGVTSWNSLTYIGDETTSNLASLSDVGISTPTLNNVLVADGVEWNARQLLLSDLSDYSGAKLQADLDVQLGQTRWRAVEVPAGGTTGQVLKKVSGANYDVGWANDDQANDASSITVIDVGGYYSTNNVESILQEIGNDLAGVGGGSGDVSKVGTPANNQVAVWTGDGTLEGASRLTYDDNTFSIQGSGTGNIFEIRNAAGDIKARFNSVGDFAGWTRTYNNDIDLYQNITLSNIRQLAWSSTTTPTIAGDVGIRRASAGVLEVTDGSSGFGSLNVVNLNPSGVVDGRDIAADGTKLDGIEAGATADQVASEVPFTPAGTIAATNVQAAIEEVAAEAGGGSSLPVIDTTAIVQGSADATKQLRFEVDTNVATATTRVLTAPGSDGTLSIISGTPAANRIATWQGAYAIGSDANFTWNGSTFSVTGSTSLTGSLDMSGDLTVSVDGSTEASPRIMGFNDMSLATEACRMKWGDDYNTIETSSGQGLAIHSFNTMHFWGGRGVASPLTISSDMPNNTTESYRFHLNNDKSFIINTAQATPTNPIFAIKNSVSSNIFEIDYNGIRVPDDMTYFFGTNSDVSIQYDSASNELAFEPIGTTNITFYDGVGGELMKIDCATNDKVFFSQNAPEVPDEAYNATNWNGSLEVPTKNAVRDEMELKANIASPTFTGTVNTANLTVGASSTFTFPTSGSVANIPFMIPIAMSNEVSDLTTGTKYTMQFPIAATITKVYAYVTTAPTGSGITVDVEDDGVSIFSTLLTIDATENSSQTAATAAVISGGSIAANSILDFDIDAVGSTTAGKGLKLWVEGYWTL